MDIEIAFQLQMTHHFTDWKEIELLRYTVEFLGNFGTGFCRLILGLTGTPISSLTIMNKCC